MSSEKRRMDWPLARVTELLPSSDGVVRSVRLFNGTHYLDRDPRVLLLLECHPQEDSRDKDHSHEAPSEDHHDAQVPLLPSAPVATSSTSEDKTNTH